MKKKRNRIEKTDHSCEYHDAEYCAALRAGITANRAQLTFLQNPQQIAFSSARLLREQSEIVYELGRRGVYQTLEACIL